MRKYSIYFSLLILQLNFATAQTIETDSLSQEDPIILQNGLLWEISRDGLNTNSYLYGTMHVSSKLAFHLTDTFYYGIEQADIVALESDPRDWHEESFDSGSNYSGYGWGGLYGDYQKNLYESFGSDNTPTDEDVLVLLRGRNYRENSYLYRSDSKKIEYEEKTYLDLFIFQAGRKQEKKVVNLEDSYVTDSLYQKAIETKPGEEKNYGYNSYNNNYEYQLEKAYRSKNLNKIDSLTTETSPTDHYRKYFLDDRNVIMVNRIDSLIGSNTLFVAVGAAHLPGNMGVINLLREKGYKVRPVVDKRTGYAKKRKKKVTQLTVPLNYTTQYSGDSSLSLKFPGPFLEEPSYSGEIKYYFPDMENGGSMTVKRLKTNNANSIYDVNYWKKEIETSLFENTKGEIIKQTNITQNGYPGIEVINKTKKGDWESSRYVFTPLEIYVFNLIGPKNWFNKEKNTLFNSISIYQNKEWKTKEFDFKNISLKCPPIVIYNKSYKSKNKYGDLDIQMLDNKTNTYSTLSTTHREDQNYFEEDTFEVKQIIRSYVFNEDSLKLDSLYLLNNKNFTSARGIVKNNKGEDLYLQSAVIGSDYFLLSSKGNKASAYKIFNSLKASYNTPIDSFKTFTDSISGITVRIPKNPKENKDAIKDLRRRFSYSYSGNNQNEEEIKKERTRQAEEFGICNLNRSFSCEQSREEIEVRVMQFGTFPDTSELNEFINLILGKKSIFSSSRTNTFESNYNIVNEKNNIYEITGFSRDTNCTKINRAKVYINKNKISGASCLYDTLNYNKAFIDTFFNSFKLIDTEYDETKNFNEIVLSKFLSNDSTKISQATSDIKMIKIEEEFTNRYINLIDIDSLPRLHISKEDSINIIAIIRLKLSKLGTEEVVDYFARKYNEPDIEDQEKAIFLSYIFSSQNDYAYEKGTNLLINNTTFGEGNVATFFGSFCDSLELAKKYMGKLKPLQNYQEYKYNFHKLTSILLDSNLIDLNDLKSKKQLILNDIDYYFKNKRAENSNSNRYSNRYGRNDYFRRNSYRSLYSAWSLKTIDEALYKLLINFKEEAKSKKIISSELKNKDQDERLEFALLLSKNEIEIPDTLINNIAQKEGELSNLYSTLEERNQLELLDSIYKDQFKLVKAMLEKKKSSYSYWGDYAEKEEKKDSLTFIERKTFLDKEDTFYVYFFKKKEKDSKDLFNLYVISYQPLDTTKCYTNSSTAKKTYSSLKDEEIESFITHHMSLFNLRFRKRMEIDYPSEKNYNFETNLKFQKLFKNEKFDYSGSRYGSF